jgi:hypothetical protein
VAERFRFRIQIVTRIWIFADPRKGQGRPETDGLVFSPALAPGKIGERVRGVGGWEQNGGRVPPFSFCEFTSCRDWYYSPRFRRQ